MDTNSCKISDKESPDFNTPATTQTTPQPTTTIINKKRCAREAPNPVINWKNKKGG